MKVQTGQDEIMVGETLLSPRRDGTKHAVKPQRLNHKKGRHRVSGILGNSNLDLDLKVMTIISIPAAALVSAIPMPRINSPSCTESEFNIPKMNRLAMV